jgi:hypothetical protein
MITNQQELIQTFEALPAEAQRQALNFIAFLHQTYKPDATLPPKPKIDWENEPVVGMWRDRQDLVDSTAWVRELRKNEWSKSNDESNNR